MAEPEPATVERPKRKQPAHLGTHGQPSPTAIDAPWQEIRDLIAAGVSMGKVAKQYASFHPSGWQALYEAIKKRAQRESWSVPGTAIARAREALAAKGVDVPTVSRKGVPAPSDPEKVGTYLSLNLTEIGEEGSLIAANLALGQLRAAHKNPAQIAQLVDVKDVSSAMKLVRTAAGMDRQGAQVQVNLWGSGMSPHVPVRDIGTSRDADGQVMGEWSDDE